MYKTSSKPDECIGTLLVHQHDMQELSAKTKDDEGCEAVGTLLVHKSDMKEFTNVDHSTGSGDGGSNETGGLVHRITKRLNEPAPDMDEAERWGA
jgi:hypothetical protein